MALRTYSTGFVGRAQELARLDAALATAVGGTPVFLLVGGEAGVGKTRLVSEFAGRAHQTGIRVLAGTCIDVSGGLPYGPIVEAFRGLERDLGAAGVRELLGPDHTELHRFLPAGFEVAFATDPAARLAQARLFELLLRLLHRLGEAAPVILVVEDLHWADQSTLDLLTFLLHNARNERLLGVATYRSDEHGGANLRGFRAEFGRLADRIELARFGRDDLTALLAEILGGPPPTQVVDRVAASSDGNPFFAEELLAAGLDREQPPLTPRLRDVLLARVQALSEDGREMLRAAATIGRRVDHGLLAVVSELTDRALLAALREAVDHQILASDPEGLYIFRHALTREAVYESLLPGERQRLHGAVARALAEDRGVAARGAPAAAELAHHWVQAGDPPRALAATIEAARRSASGAYAFAAADRLYERALDLWALVDSDDQPSGLVLTDLLREAAEAARWVDDQERAAVLVGRALDLVDPAGDPAGAAMLMERLGLYLWEVGDGKRSLDAHEAAARLLIGQPPSVAGAQVLAAHGTALMLSSRYREARRRCEEAVAMARLVGARRAETQALNTLGFAISMLGDPERGIARLEQSRVLASERQGRILEIVREEGFASIEHLSRQFDVTQQTVRRVVNQLCDQGLLRRIHGGVGLPVQNQNLAYGSRQGLNADAKRRIAHAVSSYIPDGASLMIGLHHAGIRRAGAVQPPGFADHYQQFERGSGVCAKSRHRDHDRRRNTAPP